MKRLMLPVLNANQGEKMIRDATESDAQSICDIYNYYVANSVITFEEAPIAATEMADRLAVSMHEMPWLVCEDQQNVVGYAHASKWKGRCAYRYAAEVSVYFDPQATGRGLGAELYGQLIARLRSLSIHTVIGGIALPNEASVALHEKLGFKKVAHFKQVGYKQSRWIDVGYWQLMLKTESES